MAESLRHKTVKGTAWSFADNILNQGVTFIVGLVLARLLTPDEYGLIGIITIFITVSNTIVDSGFSNALIRKKDSNDLDYDTVFLVNLGISVILCSILIVCAPLIAKFFHQPALKNLTRVMALVLIINAIGIIQRTLLFKRIDFKTQTKISFIASVTSGAVGITMAICGLGVWALVGQQLSRQGLNTLFLWVFAKWYPRLRFSVESFRELFGFGWKLMVSAIIDSTWNQMYQVVIGKCYSPVTLGLYTRAFQFSSIFSSNITTVVQRVSYPVLSQIQDDRERLKQAYRKIIKTTMLVTFTCMLMLAAVAKPLVIVLIGQKWAGCVPLLQIVCFSMMLYPLHAINLNMLQVQGRSDLFLRLEIIKKTIAIGPLLIGIFISIYWMLAASVFTGMFCYYLNAYYSGPFLHYGIWAQVKDILPSFGIALVTAGITYAASFIPANMILVLLIQLAVGFASCVALFEFIKPEEYLEIRALLINGFSKLPFTKKQ